jgi:hypothetical protein
MPCCRWNTLMASRVFVPSRLTASPSMTSPRLRANCLCRCLIAHGKLGFAVRERTGVRSSLLSLIKLWLVVVAPQPDEKLAGPD